MTGEYIATPLNPMRRPATEKQRAAYDVVLKHWLDTGRGVSTMEWCRLMGWRSQNSAHEMRRALVSMGWLADPPRYRHGVLIPWRAEPSDTLPNHEELTHAP